MAYDKSFISKLEGGRFLEPYAVQDQRAGNSGVTIATGVDLSKQDPATLTDILSQDQINYLQRRNAFTATGVDAISAAESLRGFKISEQQAEALESRVYGTIEGRLRERLTEVSGDPNSFDKMTPRQQTAIMSLAINHGPELKYNNGNNYRAIELAAAGDWNGYVSELNNFGESLPGLTKRRKQEATYLSEDFKEQEKVKQAEKRKQGRNFTGNDGKQYRWIDGDTFVDPEGQRYRVQGYDAREVYNIREDPETGLEFKYGERLGERQTDLIADFQRENDFNIIEPSTNFAGFTEKDADGRILVSLKNNEGLDFTSGLYSKGYAEINTFTSEEDVTRQREAKAIANLYGSDFGDVAFSRDPVVFKATALNEEEYASAGDLASDLYSGVQFRHTDRTLENKAYHNHIFDQAPEAFSAGWDGVKQSFLGFVDMVGVGTGAETLTNFAQPRIRRLDYELQRSPKLLMDYKDVENVWDGFSYVINNAATSAPYMGVLIGSSVLNPALGLSSTGMMHSGNVWNEIEGDKGNAQIAASLLAGAAMASLDRLGLRAIFSPTDMLSPEGRKKVVRHIAKERSTSGIANAADIRAAQEIVNRASTASMLPMLRELGNASAGDIAKLAAGKLTGKGAAAGFLAESVTEAGQEGIQYLTSTSVGTGEIDSEELENRLINAFVAGGSIGAGLGAAGGLRQYGSAKIAAADFNSREKKRLNAIEQMRMNALESGTFIPTVEQVTSQLNERDSMETGLENKEQVKQRAERHETNKRGIKNVFNSIDSFPDVFDVLFKGISKAFKASEVSAFSTETLQKSAAARKLLGLIGSTAQSVYHLGRNFEANENILVGQIRSMVDTDRIVRKITGGSVNPSSTQKASELIYNYAQTGKFPDGLTDSQKATIEMAIIQLRGAYQKAYESYSREYSINNGGKQLPKLNPDYFSMQATFDPKKVAAKPDEFKEFVKRENPGISDSEVDALYNAIIAGRSNELDLEFVSSDFSFLNGEEYKPRFAREGVEYIRGKDSGFNEFAQDNIFNNFDNFASQVAKATTNLKYFGTGGSKVAALLKEMESEGISEEEIDKVAYYVKSIVDAKNGHFKRIDNQKLESVQRYLTTYAIYIGLPLAAISSLPETAMVFFGLKNNRDFTNAMGNLMREALETLTPLTNISTGEQAATKVGLGRQQTDMAARVATGERNMAHNWYTEKFFSITGLKGITQFQRRANAAMAIDYVASGLDTLENAPRKVDPDIVKARQLAKERGLSDEEIEDLYPEELDVLDIAKFNNVQQEAFVKLTNLGLDVDQLIQISLSNNLDSTSRKKLIDIGGPQDVIDIKGVGHLRANKLTEEGLAAWQQQQQRELDLEFVNEQMETAVYKFVNERIQNPQASNRPLLFQDPHYQMLTQFNGFISTFTAVVLPKLYRDYLVKGTPRVKYETAGFVLLMMALGGASQYLKDLLKYGQPSPYLDDFEYIQRAIYSSGVIGNYERLVEMTPAALYEERSDGAIDFLFNTMVGEAGPTARNVGTLGKVIEGVTEGDAARTTENVLKLTPIGTFTGLRKELGKVAAGEENEITNFLY